jgi:hypothetical protein
MRIGAPLWLSIIIFAWGLCATAFCMIKSVTGFYVLRFLLGESRHESQHQRALQHGAGIICGIVEAAQTEHLAVPF